MPKDGSIALAARCALWAIAFSVGCARPPLVLPDPSIGLADLETAGGSASGLDDTGVRNDLRLLAAALEHAYGGRALSTPEAWRSVLDELGQIPTRGHDRASFCNAIGDALSRLTAPTVAAYEADRRCSASPTGGGMPGQYDVGANIAHEAAAAFVLDVRPGTEAEIPILAVRAFDAAASWEGWSEALDRAASATALVIDLRGAHGDDGVHARELIERITGVSAPRIALFPPRESEWADRLRVPGASPSTWSLEGEDAPEPAPRALRVVVDGACEDVCEAVAFALARVPTARLVGQPTNGRWLLPDEGELVLPASGLRVRIPLSHREVGGTAYPMAHVWPTDLYGADPLGGAWASLDADLAARARVARFEATGLTCLSAPPVADESVLSMEARSRIGIGFPWNEGVVGGSALVSLRAVEAEAFVGSCPEAEVARGSSMELATGESIVWLRGPKSVWLRLAQFDVVQRLDWDAPVYPTAQ